jgi:glutaredoxin 3
MTKSVTIYSTPTCGFCYMAKDYFKRNDIEYQEKDVSYDKEAAEEMIKKTGQLGVPVIDIDGEIVIGFNEPKIATLLK